MNFWEESSVSYAEYVVVFDVDSEVRISSDESGAWATQIQRKLSLWENPRGIFLHSHVILWCTEGWISNSKISFSESKSKQFSLRTVRWFFLSWFCFVIWLFFFVFFFFVLRFKLALNNSENHFYLFSVFLGRKSFPTHHTFPCSALF